jgi:DNA-binding FadR family transcriptional regulator
MRLQADGLVYARKGAGTFVRTRPPERLTAFAEPADVASYLRSLEARAALEGETARLAAVRRTKDQLAAIHKATRALEDALSDGRLGQDADLAFHMAVAEATGNELFPRLLGELGDLMRGSMTMALGLTRTGSELRRNRVLSEHRQIADAIAAQDGETAALYMRYHLTQTRLRTTDARSEA